MPTVIAQALTPFVTPALAWAGAAAVTVPVVIHLLSRWRRRPEPWGAMRFLLEAYRKQKRRMRLEQWLLLLLRCLIVLLLGMALARPRLVGAMAGWFGGLKDTGRIVHIVMDDSLSTQAPDGPGVTRFDRLARSARAVIGALDARDRAVIWRAGRPAKAVIAEPTADKDALRRAIDQIKPGYSRPDLPRALEMIYEYQRDRQDSSGRAVIVVLSDFSRSNRYLQRTPGQSLQSPETFQTLIVSRPLAGMDNAQVLSVEPRRRVVITGGQAPISVPVQVRVRRFSQVLSEGSVPLIVSLVDAKGRGLGTVKRQARFASGQGEVTVSVDLPLNESTTAIDTNGGIMLTVRAQIDPRSDGLTPDNQGYAAIELRSRLRVAIVDESSGLSADPDAGLSPGQWLTLALRPQAVGLTGPVEVVAVSPAELNDPASIETFDAVMLLRPDLLFDPSWSALASYAERGGLVWVFPPVVQGSAVWVNPMLKAFDLDWRVGLDPVGDEETLGGAALLDEPIKAEALRLLAGDWQALARPVRITRRLPVETPSEEAWVLMSTGEDNALAGDRRLGVVLAHHRAGRGALILLSTALDTRWTNLPTKPLFVPLLHETLRGVLGLGPRPGVIEAVAGDKPALDHTWAGVTELDRLTISGGQVMPGDASNNSTNRLALKTGDTGVQLDRPVAVPGVYQALGDIGPCRLIVNTDPQAGDTRQVSDQTLAHWLDGLGDWRWLDEKNPGSVLDQPDTASDIGWALLWVLLAIVLIETALARWMSHAHAGPGRSLTGRLWRAVRRLRSGDQDPGRQPGRAA